MHLSEIVNNLSSIKLLEFEKHNTNAFSYVFAKELNAHETVIVKMPVVSANKRGINDIGWISDGDVTLYGMLAKNPRDPMALCQEIRDYDEINKVTSAVVIVNNGDACRIEMRAILN